MKFSILLLLTTVFGISHIQAQEEYSFLEVRPLSIDQITFDKGNHIYLKIRNGSSKRTFLFTFLGGLQGLKFNSPMDEFSALKPFDVRDFKPITYSEYSSFIHRYYLLIQTDTPKLW